MFCTFLFLSEDLEASPSPLNIHIYFPWVIAVEMIIQMYSSIPSGRKEKIDISVFFFSIVFASAWQQIKKANKKDPHSEMFPYITENVQTATEGFCVTAFLPERDFN